MRRVLTIAGILIGCAVLSAQNPPPAAPAGQPGAPGGAQGGGRGGGRGRGGVPPAAYDDYTGFTKIWDGATFTNWDGERDVWSIVDGTLHADTTKTPGQHHIHYVGPNAVMKDFALKVEFKISATGANGGIQYRSRLLHVAHGGTMADPMGKPTPPNVTTMEQAIAAGLTPPPQPRGGGPGGGGGGNRGGAPGGAPGAPQAAPAPAAPPPPPNPMAKCSTGGGPGPTQNPAIPATSGNIWQVSGYQFDLDSGNGYTGQLYEGQGRSIVTAPGTFVRLAPTGPVCMAVINQNPVSAIKPHLGKDGEWNQVEIVAYGNTLVHIINGQVISTTIDDNPAFRAMQGILSLQLEGSGQIWYRNVYVKHLN